MPLNLGQEGRPVLDETKSATLIGNAPTLIGLALAVNRRCWEGALRATEDGKERQHTAPQYLSQGSV